MREKYHNLQALRGVACLMVVALHLWCLECQFGIHTPIFQEIQYFGFAGVDLFFVLSGFLIASTNRKHLGKPTALPGYLFRRFWRIYPTYWAALAVAIGFLWAVDGRGVFEPYMAEIWMWWPTLIPVEGGNPFLGQAWTLSYEVMFYIAFGMLLVLPRPWAKFACCGWAGAVGIGLAFPESRHPLLSLPTSPLVLEFLGGAFIAWLASRGTLPGWKIALAVGLAYGAVAICVAANSTTAYLDAMTSHRLRALVFGPPAVLIVYGLTAAEGRWPRSPFARLSRIGDASYSLYLFHPTALVAAKWAGVLVPHTRLGHLLWLAFAFALAIAFGFAMHAWIEKPLLKLGTLRWPSHRASLAKLARWPAAALRGRTIPLPRTP